MSRLRLAIAAAVLPFFPVAPDLAAQSGRDEDRIRPEVTDLDFRGVTAVDKDELRESIATDESGCKSMLLTPICLISKWSAVYEREYLSRAELGRDIFRIKVFYFKRGWRDVQVDTTVVGDAEKVRVVIEVREGEPTRVARVTVRRPDSLLDDERIGRLMQLRAGQPLNLIELDTSRVRLENALWDMGRSEEH